MIVITVQGIPIHINVKSLGQLCADLRTTTASFKVLGITRNDVTCFFPADLLHDGLGDEIIIHVTDIENTDKITSVLTILIAEDLAKCARALFDKASVVQCAVHVLNAPDKTSFFCIKK